MFRPDDVTLIQRFVTGASSFESNQNLRVQPANEMRQLFSRRGSVLAIANPAAHPPTIAIRLASEFSEALSKILLAYSYIPTGQDSDNSFFQYEQQEIPAGYRVHYEPARNLWKQWWIRHNHFVRQAIQMELLVQVRGKWYPIRDIILARGTLYISTHLGETAHLGDDAIVWLELEREATEQPREPVQRPASPTPDAPQKAQFEAAAPQPDAALEIDRTVQSVVRAAGGKLYIRTAIGEVVVEGSALKCYPNYAPAQAAQVVTNSVRTACS